MAEKEEEESDALGRSRSHLDVAACSGGKVVVIVAAIKECSHSSSGIWSGTRSICIGPLLPLCTIGQILLLHPRHLTMAGERSLVVRPLHLSASSSSSSTAASIASIVSILPLRCRLRRLAKLPAYIPSRPTRVLGGILFRTSTIF